MALPVHPPHTQHVRSADTRLILIATAVAVVVGVAFGAGLALGTRRASPPQHVGASTTTTATGATPATTVTQSRVLWHRSGMAATSGDIVLDVPATVLESVVPATPTPTLVGAAQVLAAAASSPTTTATVTPALPKPPVLSLVWGCQAPSGMRALGTDMTVTLAQMGRSLPLADTLCPSVGGIHLLLATSVQSSLLYDGRIQPAQGWTITLWAVAGTPWSVDVDASA